MSKLITNGFIALLIGVSFSQVNAAQTIESGQYRTPLIELYTSQECPNCEQAEAWLDAIDSGSKGVLKPAVLAFHVNYLDNAQHQDRYASKEVRGTSRQKQLVKINEGAFMYTPQVFASSREIKDWKSQEQTDGALNRIAKERAKSTIRLQVDRQGQNIQIAGAINTLPASLVYLAVYENGLTDAVGLPNRQNPQISTPHTREHQRVVRQLIGPFPVSPSGSLEKNFLLNLGPGVRQNSGVVIFVELANGEVDQVLGVAF
jgi:hypothetical protein